MNFTERIILLLSRRTWRNLARISITLLVLTFIVLLIFYFRIYLASVNEEYFDDRYQCVVIGITNNSRTCEKNQKSTSCQLVVGQCSNGRNLSLFLSWIDHDRSASECTVDPCSTSPVEFYSLNQTIDSVYVANKFNYAFLKLFSRLALRLAKIIFYLLIMFLVLSALLSICFVMILHFHKRSQKLIHPNGSIMTNASVYTRGGTIHLANSNSIQQTSTSSTKSLIVPTQVNPTVTVEQTKVEQ